MFSYIAYCCDIIIQDLKHRDIWAFLWRNIAVQIWLVYILTFSFVRRISSNTYLSLLPWNFSDIFRQIVHIDSVINIQLCYIINNKPLIIFSFEMCCYKNNGVCDLCRNFQYNILQSKILTCAIYFHSYWILYFQLH